MPDKILVVIDGDRAFGTYEYGVIDGSLDGGYDDTLKLTKTRGVRVFANKIIGGFEDCVDMNVVEDCIVNCRAFVAGGEYVATIKGGSRAVTLTGTIYQGGRTVDVDLGNWSDQSQEKTRGVRLSLIRIDGRKVKVRVLHAERPIFVNGPQNYTYAFPSPNLPFGLHGLIVWAVRGAMRIWKKLGGDK